MAELKWSEIKHFDKEEWVDDPSKAAPKLVQLADDIREYVGHPMHIHVCWAEDGHTDESYHYTGQAVDVHFGGVDDMLWLYMVLANFKEIGGLGFYPEWKPKPGWHIDIRRRERRLVWTYRNGAYHYGESKVLNAMS